MIATLSGKRNFSEFEGYESLSDGSIREDSEGVQVVAYKILRTLSGDGKWRIYRSDFFESREVEEKSSCERIEDLGAIEEVTGATVAFEEWEEHPFSIQCAHHLIENLKRAIPAFAEVLQCIEQEINQKKGDEWTSVSSPFSMTLEWIPLNFCIDEKMPFQSFLEDLISYEYGLAFENKKIVISKNSEYFVSCDEFFAYSKKFSNPEIFKQLICCVEEYREIQIFSSLLSERYDVMWPKKERVFDGMPEVFFITENCSAESIRKINGLFISTVATPGSVLLIEGSDSSEPLSRERLQRKMSAHWIRDGVFEEGHVLGWSASKRQIMDVRNRAVSICCTWLKKSHVCMEKFQENILEKISFMKESVSRGVFAHPNVVVMLEELVTSAQEVQESWNKIAEAKRKNFLEIQDAEAELSAVLKSSGFSLTDLYKREELSAKINDLYLCSSEIKSKIDSFNSEIERKLYKRVQAQKEEISPSSMVAMVSSIQKVRGIVGREKKIFVLAKEEHFFVKPTSPDFYFRLECIYPYLEQINAIILRPKGY